MNGAHRLYVGTVGEGLFRSLDGGRTFKRACAGMFVECDVRALVIHPDDPRTLYLGSEQGVYVSTDGADTWSRLDAPVTGLQVWSLCLLPGRPEVILAGTCPARIFRSTDAGRTWEEARAAMRPDCPGILYNRVTCLLVDPEAPDHLWAGVEIDGVYESRDAGRSWEPIGTGLSSRDMHALVRIPAAAGQPARLLATTNNDLNVSTDDGQTWKPCGIGAALPWPYCRALAQPVGRPAVVLLGNGDGPPGATGLVARSSDGGLSWQPALPDRANSTIWAFAVHPADPALVYAASVSGQVYRSTDGGTAWEKLPREFGEIRALAWAPA